LYVDISYLAFSTTLHVVQFLYGLGLPSYLAFYIIGGRIPVQRHY
jgi:hypothetical protein